jgi:hypothetical protein
MSKLEALEKRVSGLSAEELAEFRRWFAEFDAAAWDRQIDRDAKVGKLDALADEALRDHAAGKSTEFSGTSRLRSFGSVTGACDRRSSVWRMRNISFSRLTLITLLFISSVWAAFGLAEWAFIIAASALTSRAGSCGSGSATTPSMTASSARKTVLGRAG